MTNLTEQWKKGELKLGEHYYYTTIFSPTVYIQNFTRDVISFQDFKETVAEVLAEVPSYDEWQASEKYNKHLEVEIREKETQRIELMTRLNDVNNENHALEIENTKLKELLKECEHINIRLQNALWQWNEESELYEECDKIEAKINQALGENK